MVFLQIWLLSLLIYGVFSGFPVKQMPFCFHYDLEYNFYDYCDTPSNKQECYDLYAELVSKMADAHHERDYCFSIDANVFWDNKNITFESQTYNMLQFVLEYCDRVALMDYNNDVEKVLKQAKAEIEYYDSVGKQLDIGLLVDPPANVESFYGKSNTEFEDALTTVHNHFKSHKSFGMVAIHHLQPWMDTNPLSLMMEVDRAVWSWDLGESILTNSDSSVASEREEIISFMFSNRVRKIYVAAETSLIYRPQGLAKFLNDSFDVGISVELEIGDSSNPAKGKEWLFNHVRAVDFANQMMDVIDDFYWVPSEYSSSSRFVALTLYNFVFFVLFL